MHDNVSRETCKWKCHFNIMTSDTQLLIWWKLGFLYPNRSPLISAGCNLQVFKPMGLESRIDMFCDKPNAWNKVQSGIPEVASCMIKLAYTVVVAPYCKPWYCSVQCITKPPKENWYNQITITQLHNSSIPTGDLYMKEIMTTDPLLTSQRGLLLTLLSILIPPLTCWDIPAPDCELLKRGHFCVPAPRRHQYVMACNSNDKGPSPATCSQNLLHISTDGDTKQSKFKVQNWNWFHTFNYMTFENTWNKVKWRYRISFDHGRGYKANQTASLECIGVKGSEDHTIAIWCFLVDLN